MIECFIKLLCFFPKDIITAWMPSAIMTSWMPPRAERWLRDIKPVSVWRTPAAIQVWGEDTPAQLTHRSREWSDSYFSTITVSHFISRIRTTVFFGAGIGPRLLWHLQCQHRLPVDWYYGCFSWRLYPKGELSVSHSIILLHQKLETPFETMWTIDR